VSPDRTGRAGDNDVAVLPGRVREPLGELVGAAREGLLSRPVQVGLGVLRELLGLSRHRCG
jgi:hypothetical protein